MLTNQYSSSDSSIIDPMQSPSMISIKSPVQNIGNQSAAAAAVAGDRYRNLLCVLWNDQSCPAVFINASNVLNYFCNHANPFYDSTCSNETLKMQRLSMDQLSQVFGIEYVLEHSDEPLFVIRKQRRHNAREVTPLAYYYVIGGTVYQAPDFGSILNARLLTALHHVRLAFEEAHSYMRYQPSKGYSWDFGKGIDNFSKKDEKKTSDTKVTAFQRNRVEGLLAELVKQFPPPDASPKTKDEAGSKLSTVATSAAAADTNLVDDAYSQMAENATKADESESGLKRFKSDGV